MTLNKKENENSFNIQFRQINDLIKNLLKESKINEKNINDIIFIGDKTNINILKERISKIFKVINKELLNKLTNNNYIEKDNDNGYIYNK